MARFLVIKLTRFSKVQLNFESWCAVTFLRAENFFFYFFSCNMLENVFFSWMQSVAKVALFSEAWKKSCKFLMLHTVLSHHVYIFGCWRYSWHLVLFHNLFLANCFFRIRIRIRISLENLLPEIYIKDTHQIRCRSVNFLS